ncbi:copper amine oxidase N-terminal domain-containing protein [Paenibacillus albus]|uniref:Copper amine oxidase N-terminal domain-containing protein n=1 Tax=Paenibacillus albus TaxID=2495582 RepID=A0A3Q8X4X4_9BACL|nr:copper amine oxidase N-terminal domain-containing protein [Paenibacillus albus]AZN40598.1 copper amine oxidase N-terminal domain-containing protein [Paenibacillus albus]
MKFLKWLLVLSFLVMPFVYASDGKAAALDYSDKLTLTIGSKNMKHNSTYTKTAQPVTAINGVSFIPFASVAAQYGYKISYNAKTKESIATGPLHTLKFKINSAAANVDGYNVKLTGATYILNGSLMVPLRSWGNVTDSAIAVVNKTITLSWNSVILPQQPKANFEVQPAEIYAGQTNVTYVDRSYNPADAPFVDERWDGRMDVFPDPGTYTVTRQVEDINGIWSEPYSVTITVKPANQPPVANFSTEKETYRIGEAVLYTDLSTDDENAIVRRTWTGNDKVFFEPGNKQVTLEVEDRHGLVHSITKTVTVTSEVLYTKDEYYRLFTPIGEKFPIDSGAVLKMPSLPYTFHSEQSQMVRSNSPEALLQEGIVYESQLSGQVRFLFHNVNHMFTPVKMYLLATNNNQVPVNLSTGSIGLGGPDPYVENTAKMSTIRYLQSLANNPSPRWMTIKPGETKEVLPELSRIPMKPLDVLTTYADLYADQELQFKIVVVASNKNVFTELPKLGQMPRDGKHVRGTFNKADRSIEMSDILGNTAEYIKLGDKTMDTYLDGIDETTGNLEYNIGNFGVLYRLTLPHVAPHTLIALNARGGYYTGAFMVNGQVIPVTNSSILKDNKEAAVLYRTGDSEESVEIVFTLSAGSNLPLAMMFLPLPGARW